jgi:Replicative DNA helicase
MELGLNHIDGTINGLPKGKLITVIGQSVDGRDIMLNTLVKNIAVDQRIPSLVLNLATSEDTFYYELIANINKVPIDDIRNGNILSSCDSLAKTEIYVDFSKDRSLEYLEKTIRHYVSKGVEMVFIDFFKL